MGERHGAELVRFLDAMPAAFGVLDDDWRFRYVNTEAERLIGRPRDRVLGQSLWSLFPALAGSVYETTYRSAIASGEAVTFLAAVPGEGDTWFEVRAWPGPDGAAVHVLDVTEQRQTEEAARRAGARAALIDQVNAELAGALDTESALARLARLVVPLLADGCIVTMIDRDGRPKDVGSWHADPEHRALIERYTRVRLEALPVNSPVARALQAGTPVTESVATVLRLMPEGPARSMLEALGPASAVVLPLTAESRTVGVLTLYQDAGRVFREEDLRTARKVAGQAARAIARVHRQSQQAQLAEALQRSLLTDPPSIEGTQIAVRYVPAAEAARVGGDWYDAFLQQDGSAVVVIGDVVGHDTAAAAAMGQLRGLLRGIAHYSGSGPAEVLRGLDEAIAHMHTDTLATAAVARLERAGPGVGWSRLRWANAGHPPPILLSPDGDVTVLGDEIGDLLLGVDASGHRREQAVDLAPGSTLLLYTDGLVERRDSTIDAGTACLVEHLRAHAGRPPGELCDRLLEEIVPGTHQDDVALVAVCVTERHPDGPT
jgi:PAS domain S-box-containing protein